MTTMPTPPRSNWIAGGLLGAILVALGVLLFLHPFDSVNSLILLIGGGLVLLALTDAVLALTGERRQRWTRFAAAAIALVVGVLVLALPGLSVRLLVILLAIGLAVGGIREIALIFGRGATQRWTHAAFGIAGVVGAIVMISWPDITVLGLGVVFGVWLIAFGLRVGIRALLRRFQRRAARPTRPHPVWRGVTAGVALLAAAALAIVGIRLSGGPVPDAFYTPPADVPAQAGQLLRVEAFDREVPSGAQAWRMLYTTTGLGDVSAVASALVIVPLAAGPHPVIGWTHGTTGVATGCAPSLAASPFTSGGMPDLDEAIAAGWAVVATDYIGLGTPTEHQYVVGEPAGRAELDALRAARQIDGTDLADETVLWGHSQGGHAALWTAGLAADYAPELDIRGVAAMAPAANLPALLESFADDSLSLLFGAFVLKGYAPAYDDVRVSDYVKPSARLAVDEVASRCLASRSTIVSALEAGFSGGPVWSRDPGTGPLAEHADENVPRLPIAFPVLLAQGLADPLIAPPAQQAYVDARCQAGQAIDYRTYPGLDHMGVVSAGSPLLGELMTWTADRFSGRDASPTCG